MRAARTPDLPRPWRPFRGLIRDRESGMTGNTRLLRLGKARRLTRAVMDGDLVELNADLRWEMPAA